MKKVPKLGEMGEAALTEAISVVIQRHRARLGLSRDLLAFKLEIHRNSLYYIEVGTKRGEYPFRRQQISLLNFVRMADLFGVEPGELLGEVTTEMKSATVAPKR
jgi:DNA-binding XRE family transcriptional regulator